MNSSEDCITIQIPINKVNKTMPTDIYQNLIELSLKGPLKDNHTCYQILDPEKTELLPLLQSAYTLRKRFCGNSVKIHILNNVQNGLCKEDCQYCAQSRDSKASIETYPMKSDEEIMEEARNAYEKGAFRYCMVFSGKGISDRRINHIASIVREIKKRHNIEVCVSAGTVTIRQAQILKDAGLNRLNHNLNTSENIYKRICSTHTYEDRLKTLQSAKQAQLQICSGVILGMGETRDDIIEMARTLHNLRVESIPVNFFMPIEGLPLTLPTQLTPEQCLRILCLFRFLNPRTEIRVAAGRELYLRDMEVMAFYPANSLFMEGYLNTRGKSRRKTLQMLKDANFTIESDKDLDALLQRENAMEDTLKSQEQDKDIGYVLTLKKGKDLRILKSHQ